MSRKGKYVRTPNFAVSKREGLELFYATGVFGGLSPIDGRMFFVADRLELEPGDLPGTQKVKEVNQEIQAEVHMSPATYKSIAMWMMKNVENFEKKFGEIQMGKPEDNKDQKRMGSTYV